MNELIYDEGVCRAALAWPGPANYLANKLWIEAKCQRQANWEGSYI